jgi:hypothetical protein
MLMRDRGHMTLEGAAYVVRLFRPRLKAHSLAVLARGEAEKQDSSIKRAIRDAPTLPKGG